MAAYFAHANSKCEMFEFLLYDINTIRILNELFR